MIDQHPFVKPGYTCTQSSLTWADKADKADKLVAKIQVQISTNIIINRFMVSSIFI